MRFSTSTGELTERVDNTVYDLEDLGTFKQTFLGVFSRCLQILLYHKGLVGFTILYEYCTKYLS